jgi:hypothetical protein
VSRVELLAARGSIPLLNLRVGRHESSSESTLRHRVFDRESASRAVMLLPSGCTGFAMLMASGVLSAARILLSKIVFAALSAGAVTCAAGVAGVLCCWNGA